MRLFVSIAPAEEAIPPISKAARPLEGALGARMVPEKNLHMTLVFLGEVPDEKLGRVAEALAEVKFGKFDVELSGAGAYPSQRVPRAIWIGGKSEGARALSEKIMEALSFLPLEKREFSVHLTVARSKGVADVEEFIGKTGRVCEFAADRFLLVKSTLTPAGPQYEIIREYRAQG